MQEQPHLDLELHERPDGDLLPLSQDKLHQHDQDGETAAGDLRQQLDLTHHNDHDRVDADLLRQ